MIINLLAGLLGLIFMVLHKMGNVKKDLKLTNQEFVLSKFFSCELTGIGMSLVVIILMAITTTEWLNISPKVANYVTIIFALGGAIGSWAFLLILGTSQNYFRKIVDINANIVTNEIGKTEGVKELKQAAVEAGKDITPPPK